MALKTVYVGPIIQCKSLTELDINLNGCIGVDENGKISFVEREHVDRSDPEWSEAEVVHLGKNEFLFPGFIGECSTSSRLTILKDGTEPHAGPQNPSN